MKHTVALGGIRLLALGALGTSGGGAYLVRRTVVLLGVGPLVLTDNVTEVPTGPLKSALARSTDVPTSWPSTDSKTLPFSIWPEIAIGDPVSIATIWIPLCSRETIIPTPPISCGTPAVAADDKLVWLCASDLTGETKGVDWSEWI
jgi:hypothetical protein